MAMRIMAWNCNSIKARKERSIAILKKYAPDVVCLQELKCETSAFPFSEIESLGYHAQVKGQKAYNGVAILSRKKSELVFDDFQLNPNASDSRIIGAKIDDVLIASVYVPNGQAVGSEKFSYKLQWLQSLHDFMMKIRSMHSKIVLAGDFNIALEDRDVYDPKALQDALLFSDQEKKALRKILDLGFIDSFRILNQEEGKFSWWDYRMLCFQKGKGLRIDYVFCSESMAPSCIDVGILRDERKGKKPSDHAPVFAVFEELS